jgi:hypothetical protein
MAYASLHVLYADSREGSKTDGAGQICRMKSIRAGSETEELGRARRLPSVIAHTRQNLKERSD